MWEALINMQVPESLIRRIMKGYEGSKCYVRTPVGQTDWFLPGKGVQQGSVLSPILFNVVMKQTNKNGMRIERHLPKTDESIVRPAGERR